MNIGHDIAQARPVVVHPAAYAAILRQEFRQFVECCMTGRHASSRLTINSPTLDEDQTLIATDRGYRVTSRGWRRVETDKDIPARRSQIRLLPKTRRDKYALDNADLRRAAAARESTAPVSV